MHTIIRLLLGLLPSWALAQKSSPVPAEKVVHFSHFFLNFAGMHTIIRLLGGLLLSWALAQKPCAMPAENLTYYEAVIWPHTPDQRASTSLNWESVQKLLLSSASFLEIQFAGKEEDGYLRVHLSIASEVPLSSIYEGLRAAGFEIRSFHRIDPPKTTQTK
ncbi:MAG: hypothetical protein RMK19_08575 [Bacteroidia bacterium]|nr:hypothetical protein [Bacteroidia bacterium]